MTESLSCSPEIVAASRGGRPIVALESAVITHGMPWPRNLETARQMEAEIRAGGAVPATVAVIEGTLQVGLGDTQLEALAKSEDVAKLSRADLAAAIATGGTGATTAAATMIAARLAGIEVFATDGIGGVHRGAAFSFDISADLRELAQTPVTVVASGAKAILDLPKTWEMLESLGVPVIAIGQDVLPAFWSARSPCPAPLRLDTARDVAAAHKTRIALGLPGGQLIANPIPEENEIPASRLEPLIANAVAEATELGISAKSVTPFLLARISEATNGASLDANVALLLDNARLASRIAGELVASRHEG